MNEDFNEGRIQYAFIKVKDPNTGLPKYVLIAWCGGGVPERTKGYFTSHTAAVSKILHGYHVQITARSDSDLEPEAIMRKVADASGAKYSAGSAGAGGAAPAPPPIKSKPVFTPTTSSAARNPLVEARQRRDVNVDEDGWGEDAPPVTRTEVQKVESAYKPTKVNMAELTKQKPEPSRFAQSSHPSEDDGVVRGGYQPVGKVDIAAIRAAAKEKTDDRPTAVKGAYEPVGKVDIAAIKAKAKPQQERAEPEPQQEEAEQPRSLADRASAFSQPTQSERITSMPKPKVSNKFGGGSTFTGTKPPAPGGSGLGLGGPAAPAPPPVGAASRTFADQGGKTPAQLWAEKKAKERGTDVGSVVAPSAPAVQSQTSGGNEWKSGYSGKSWAPVQTSGNFGRPEAGQISAENTGEPTREIEEQPTASSGGVSALKDRFKGAAPMGAAAGAGVVGAGAVAAGAAAADDDEPEPESEAPPVPSDSRPSGGFALPGLPTRPPPPDEEEEEEDPSAYQPQPESPPRVAIPISRGADNVDHEEDRAPPPLPPSQIDVPQEEDLPNEREQNLQARAAAEAVAEQSVEPEQIAAAQSEQQGGYRAVVQYDYEKAEDNEIELVEGDLVTDIDMIDEGWWMGTSSRGERGLFPCNYVELVEDDGAAGAQPEAQPEAPPSPEPAPAVPATSRPPPAASAGPTATAIYDYEAGEDNGKIVTPLVDGTASLTLCRNQFPRRCEDHQPGVSR